MTARRAMPDARRLSDEQHIAEALGALVAAIGGPAFPVRFLEAMRAVAGVELCSLFQRNRGEAVKLVFAEGVAGLAPDFPARASLDYARSYWRSDHQITRLAHSGRKGPIVVRKRAGDIADPAYRAACYERADVRERLTIFWPGPPTLIANGYCTARREAFSGADVERLECWAGVLMHAVERHLQADAGPGHLYSEAGLVQSLMALGCGLSMREAEISAAIILGETQDDIAARKQLSHGTVVTYRRRAYGKLGAGNRRDLLKLHRAMIGSEFVDTPRT